MYSSTTTPLNKQPPRNEKMNFLHLHEDEKITLAYKFVETNKLDGTLIDKSIHIGFALCSNKDSYSKKIGRDIATDRLIKQPIVIPIKGSEKRIKDKVKAFLPFLAQSIYHLHK